MSTFTPLLVIDFDGERVGYCYSGPEYVDGIAFQEATFDLGLPSRGIDFMATGGGGGGGGGGSSVNVTVSLEKPWSLRQRGVRLQRSEAVLYAWQGETDLARAEVLFRGELTGVSFDHDSNMCDMQIVKPIRSSDVSFPKGIISAETFPDPLSPGDSVAADAALGQIYPVIYGECFGVPVLGVGVEGANHKMLVAGHRITSTSVVLTDKDGTDIGPFGVAEDRDNEGNLYSYIELPVAGNDPEEAWTAKEVTGKPSPGGQPIVGLGDVLLDLWRSYGDTPLEGLDMGRIREAQPKLNKYAVSAFFNSRTTGQTLLQIMSSRFASQFPVVFGDVAGRYGWTALEEPTEPRVAATLRYGHNTHTRSEIDVTSSEIVRNRFSATYKMNGFQGQEVEAFKVNKTNSGTCAGSDSRWGPSPLEEYSLGDIADSGTVYAVLESIARRLRDVRDEVEYGNLGVEFLRLPLLSVVSVTDDVVGWSDKLFLLTSVSPQLSGEISAGFISL